MLDIQSPIITIGAGRSGSTLLQRMLNKHPIITFFNENSFPVAHLWFELWQDRFWFDSETFVAIHRTSAHALKPRIDSDFFQHQRARIGQMLAKTVADVHQLKLARHPLYHFCVQRYHQVHTLLEQRNGKKKDKPN